MPVIANPEIQAAQYVATDPARAALAAPDGAAAGGVQGLVWYDPTSGALSLTPRAGGVTIPYLPLFVTSPDGAVTAQLGATNSGAVVGAVSAHPTTIRSGTHALNWDGAVGLTPGVSAAYGLGTATLRWLAAHAVTVTVGASVLAGATEALQVNGSARIGRSAGTANARLTLEGGATLGTAEVAMIAHGGAGRSYRCVSDELGRFAWYDDTLGAPRGWITATGALTWAGDVAFTSPDVGALRTLRVGAVDSGGAGRRAVYVDN